MTRAVEQQTTKRLQQQNDIKRFLNSQHALMLIVGEIASGKTTLLSDVVLQIRNARNIIRLQGAPNLIPSQLLNALSKHWAISNLEQHERIETQLDGMLNEISNQSQSCILVIDDAHLLPLSALAAISHLVTQQDGKHTHLHIILSGLPVLAEKINNLLTKEIQQITVGALSREEAFRKIKRLLDNAGLYLPHAAANAIFTKLYRRSAGMPETLENMVKKLLAQRTAGDNTTQISPNTTIPATRLWQAHRIKSVSLIALIVVGYVFWGWQHHAFLFSHHKTPTIPPYHSPSTQQASVISTKPVKPIAKPAATDTATQKPHYILQLLSGMNIQAMTAYIQQHHLNQITQIMKTQYKGHDWYVLAYGNYDQAAQAKSALASLPETLKSHHPWVRSTQQLAPMSGPNSR